MRKLHLQALGLAAAAALITTGCGGGGGSESESAYGGGGGETASQSAYGGRAYGGGSSSAAQTTSAAEGGGAATISVGSVPELGRVLVDSRGFTVYDFHKDKGGESACYGPCAKAWPPVLTEGAPQPSNGTSSSKLGTTKRKDGTVQVTYAGWPLYSFAEDKKPGDAKGNDVDAFGAQWYALTPQGTEPGD